MIAECECLNCGHRFRGNILKDNLGIHCECEKCGSSFDVTLPKKPSNPMRFMDAKILVKTAAEHNILRYTCPKKLYIFIYHAAGDENHPEGWYADDVDDVAQAVMRDIDAQNMLISKLHELNVEIPWFDYKKWDETYRMLGIEQEEKHEN